MKTLREIFQANKKMNWEHEYAEDGVINFDDFSIAAEHYLLEHTRELKEENSRLLEEKAKLIEKINAWKEHEKQAMYPSYYYTGRTDALNNVLQLLTSPQ